MGLKVFFEGGYAIFLATLNSLYNVPHVKFNPSYGAIVKDLIKALQIGDPGSFSLFCSGNILEISGSPNNAPVGMIDGAKGIVYRKNRTRIRV